MRFSSFIAALSVFAPVLPAFADANVALKPGDAVSSCVTADPVSAHSFKPHCKETIARAGSSAELSYNALGLRDKDCPDHPKPGWKRILFIGSSRMAGPGLPEPQTPPRRMEAYLGGAKNKIEVINAGVEGYTPVLEATKIHDWLEAYHPTHVVLDVEFEPAVSADTMYYTYQHEDERGRPVVTPHVFGWMKPFAAIFGADLSQYQGQRKAMTWQAAGYRMLRALRCRLTSFSREKLTTCVARPTLDAMTYIRKASVASGAKMVYVFPPGNFTNRMNLSPAYDPDAFNTFDKLTPELTMTSNAFVSHFKKRNSPYQLLIPVRGDDLTLPGDYHFNAAGADFFARGAMLRLQGFLETGESLNLNEHSGPKRGPKESR